MRQFVLAVAATLSLLVAGCQAPITEKTGPLTIQSVTVTSAATFKPASDIKTPVQRRLNGALVGRDPGGQPVNVDLTLQRVTYKDPVLSLLVGSTNAIASSVVIRSAGGNELAQFDVVDTLDTFPQGVIGAIGAAIQQDHAVDQEFVQVHSRSVERRIFGDKPRPPEPVAPATPAPAAEEETAPVS